MKTVLNEALEPTENLMSIKKTNLKIFIIAGEVSGDILGAKVMKELPQATFVGVGGENMTKQGLKPLFNISDIAVMGIVEVLAHASTLQKRIKQTVQAILSEKPDIVLTIDSPGFAKSVIKAVKKSSLSNKPKFYHIVAPQVWAWGARRAKKFAKIFDKLYCFFDFEVPFFTQYGLKTMAVGHPIADGLDTYIQKQNTNTNIITLLPGSRLSEVKKTLPILRNVVNGITSSQQQNYQYVIPTVETTDAYIKQSIQKWEITPTIIPSNKRYDVFTKTFIAIAASGTISAELAIMHIPTIVFYKMNPISTFIIRMIILIKWVSLVNILLKKEVFPELLGNKATDKNIINQFNRLIKSKERIKLITELYKADNLWKKENSSPAKLIANDIIYV